MGPGETLDSAVDCIYICINAKARRRVVHVCSRLGLAWHVICRERREGPFELKPPFPPKPPPFEAPLLFI